MNHTTLLNNWRATSQRLRFMLAPIEDSLGFARDAVSHEKALANKSDSSQKQIDRLQVLEKEKEAMMQRISAHEKKIPIAPYCTSSFI